jgi:hypothetical protein
MKKAREKTEFEILKESERLARIKKMLHERELKFHKNRKKRKKNHGK